ncbi:hypothetical protein DFH08DRAFT_1076886 [Mycena albidolilacea]|uniref:Uncharacterized protein n=1 Tax=Mycena albidolilacea TaxID=1033008 RepID=A0AAD7ADT0_9AGAR|nr:hypothetical protein DFH08DRAFT_1076886 [Mycena albidolilacea]
MATACITSATATTTSLLTKDVLTTTFSTSVLTEPPTTTTITSEGCILGSISDVVPCISTPTIFTSTIPGNITTITVPFTATTATTETETLTLFGSSCSVIASDSSKPIDSKPTSNHGPGPGPGSSFSASVTTPDPITFTSATPVTLPNGDVSAVMETFTSHPPASTVYVPFTPSGQVAQSNDDRSSSQAGPIVGGVLGGFFGLLGIVLIIWFIMKRRRRWDDIFDQEDPAQGPTKRWSLDAEMEPKPYQYGLVGQTSSPSLPSLGMSSLDSPPASGQLPRQNQTHNLTPLLLPTSASTPGPSATTLSSRPSTAGSMLPPAPPAPASNHKPTDSSGSSTSVQQHISPAMPSHWGHHSPSPSTDQAYFFERSGSPTSMREWEPQRRLQLANVGDDESVSSPMTPSASILDGKGPGRHARIGSTLSGVLVDAAP